jgi:heme/copper-type cytochrome/quinol oxidase subunit 3
MLVFVSAEVMFFAGLASAFLIAKAGSIAWPPPGQPRLPVEVTAFNTAMLLASGGLLLLAGRAFAGRDLRRTGVLMAGAVGLGAFFVALQGFEWLRLIRFGLTLTSSTYGAFFYLVVGVHALHVLGALVALARVAANLRAGTLARDTLQAVSVLWYFVVGLWPFLYVLVYLL